MVNWFGYKREALKEKIIEAYKKNKYGEDIKQNEEELVNLFFELNKEKDVEQNIENFFYILEDLIKYNNSVEIL